MPDIVRVRLLKLVGTHRLCELCPPEEQSILQRETDSFEKETVPARCSEENQPGAHRAEPQAPRTGMPARPRGHEGLTASVRHA